MATKTKKQPNARVVVAQKRQFRTAIIEAPAYVVVDVDIDLIAEAFPKFQVKDLVVIAMAMGGRVIAPNLQRNQPMRIKIQIADTEAVAEAVDAH